MTNDNRVPPIKTELLGFVGVLPSANAFSPPLEALSKLNVETVTHSFVLGNLKTPQSP